MSKAAQTSTAGRAAILDEISAERQRQIDVEGYGLEHDDQHIDGSIAKAAACYAIMGAETGDWHRKKLSEEWWGFSFSLIRGIWPWEWRYFKPLDNRADLVRSGALIVAEIERIDRTAIAAAKTGRKPERKPLLLSACAEAGMCMHVTAGCICDEDPSPIPDTRSALQRSIDGGHSDDL